jgi:hypothetical protein
MKICTHCQKHNPDEGINCWGCGTPLPEEASQSGKSASPVNSVLRDFRPRLVDFAELGEVFEFAEGFPYPDWKRVSQYIRGKIPKNNWEEAWHEIIIRWLTKFEPPAGEKLYLGESENFFLLSGGKPGECDGVLKCAEAIKTKIRQTLLGLTLKEVYGKHVIIIFDGLDNYYRYISYFYPDGEYPMSSGIFLKKGYGHIAIPQFDERNNQAILTHELAHNALMALPVPVWLNEGVAQILEMQFSYQREMGFDHDMDLIESHRTYWTTETIQKFWTGDSFHAQESAELSYSLAKILLNLISSESGDFKNLLQSAHFCDAGEAAFSSNYGKKLGEIAGIFLGPGDWSPQQNLLKSRFTKAPVPPKI